MATINITEVLQICGDVVKDPTSKQANEALKGLQKRLEVRTYLPMAQKASVLFRATMDSDRPYDDNYAIFTMAMEVAMVFDGLLAYTNIEPVWDNTIKNYDSYDILEQSGFIDYVLQFCERDYNKLARLFERTVSVAHLMSLFEVLENVDGESVKALTTAINKFTNEADGQLVKDVADIMRYNDPELHQLKEDVVEEVIDKIKRMDKLDKI